MSDQSGRVSSSFGWLMDRAAYPLAWLLWPKLRAHQREVRAQREALYSTTPARTLTPDTHPQ